MKISSRVVFDRKQFPMHKQTWKNAQACKQCLCKFVGFGVDFLNLPAFYIGNAQKGLCKAKFPKFAYVKI